MKRRRLNGGGSVTGGTGDVKPQILTTGVTQATVNEYQVISISLPVPRFGTMRQRATIFEILKVYFYFGQEDLTDLSKTLFSIVATNDLGRATGDTCSNANNQIDRLETNTLAMAYITQHQTTSGGFRAVSPVIVDLTDSNGNGVLVGTDKISYICGSNAATTASTFAAKILYRQVNVGVEEYVGIVQSQLQ